MRIERWTGPPVETHTYLAIDEPTGEAWAIDAPLDTAASVLDFVRNNGLRLTKVVLTHGHFDHILDAPAYASAGIPIALHPADFPLLEAPQTAMFGLPQPMPSFTPNEELAAGTSLSLGNGKWVVWHVPGHAPGHVILYSPEEATILGGDLLFRGGYGRVDLPGADPALKAASMLRLLDLPDRTRVYPGHGPETTIGQERPWLESLLNDPRGIRL